MGRFSEIPGIYYRAAVFDYGSEIEVRIYPSAVPLPGSRPSRSRQRPDRIVESLDDIRTGYEPELWSPDLDDVLARQERSQYVSLNRSRAKIYSIARGNEWEWFCTFTFSPDVVDRYDYDAVSSLMVKWLHNCRVQSDDMFYIVVPELHQDGAIHFHGLFSRCAAVLRLKHFRDDVYNIGSFVHGYTTAKIVANPDAAACYISKYITKDLCAVSSGRRRYWASRNVSAPEPMRCSLDQAEVDDFSVRLFRSAPYSSSALSPEGYVQYFHFKADQMPDDIKQFLKLHSL